MWCCPPQPSPKRTVHTPTWNAAYSYCGPAWAHGERRSLTGASCAGLPREMGANGFDYESAEDVFSEISGLVKAYAEITYADLEDDGQQWPRRDEFHDTPILHAEANEQPKPRMEAMSLVEPPAQYANNMYLAKGRLLHDNRRPMSVVKNNGTSTVEREEIIELHETDAAALGISDGDRVVAATSSREHQRHCPAHQPAPGARSGNRSVCRRRHGGPRQLGPGSDAQGPRPAAGASRGR